MDHRNHKLGTLLTGLFILILLVTSAGAVTRSVPATYATIGAAIGAAASGDTIQVSSGIYYERITVNKQLTLQGVDTGSGVPIIDGSGGGDVINLNYNGCTVDGFWIRNAGTYRVGIQVSSDGNTISNNNISNNNVGINVLGQNYNHILNNVISSNTDGIQMHSGSSNNEISGNAVTYNNRNGIMLSYSAHNNTIIGNDASYNGQTTLGDGISVYLCNNLIISGNTVSKNRQDGLYIMAGNNAAISGNTAGGNSRSGIGLSYGSSNCVISGNTITGNTYRGFEITSSSGNTFFTNILSNSANAYSTSNDNDWNSTTSISWAYGSRTFTGLLGNVWSDYSGLDCNDDGLGDTPYLIAGGSEKDYHPIGGAPCSLELEVEKLADRDAAQVGDWINYTIHVNNTGNAALTGVRAWDNLTSTVWTVGTLVPGGRYTNTTRYRVKLSDLPGPVTNELWANCTDPQGLEVNGSSIETVQIQYDPQISLVKKTNGQDANSAPGPYIPVNGPVTWTYNVTNTGNVNLTSVTVADNVTGVVGTISLLRPGQSQTLTKTGTAVAGQYSNLGNATGTTPTGSKVSDEDPSQYFGQSAGISLVKKTNGQDANSAPGPYIPLNGPVTWTYNVTNTGNANLTDIEVKDNVTGVVGTIALLFPGQSRTLTATGTAAAGQYSNMGNATGTTPTGSKVSDEDLSHYFGQSAGISLVKKTNGQDANSAPGPYIPHDDPVTWTYQVNNTGNANLINVQVADNVTGVVGTISLLLPGQTLTLTKTGTAEAGQYSNMGNATGTTPTGSKVSDEDPSHYYGELCNLSLSKTTDKPTVHRGEEITYTIDLSNPCGWGNFTNVTLWDILPKSVELVSVLPAPSSSSSSNLTWDVGTLGPYQHFPATIVVRVPIVDINYDMSQEVRGEGFVNVHNDYDTHQGPDSITNCAYARADLVETVSSCASTGIVDPGTQLQSREFGSGTYESEELTRMRTENKSIRSVSNLSAVHRPTSFSLPQNRSIKYATKWTDKSRGINTITGASLNEEYTFAGKIDKDRSIELDRNGSTMKTEVEFQGSGHIGVLKKPSPDAHPKSRPIFESAEDYLGSFKVFEMVDEYGSSVKSNKSVTGYGYAAADRRVRDSQRTYESGTGSYQSDEIIDTPSNYIAKDISLVHGPTSYNYTPGFGVSQNMLWSEGMWSKSGYLAGGDIFKDSSNCGIPVIKMDNSSPPASYIRERYSSLDYLKKETIASGLNEMKTNASFSGMADFEVKSIGDNQATKVDNEERYVGQYSIARKVLLTGVSRYDRPHITVQKVGNMTTRWYNKTNALVARYVITITNDGNVALAPINVRDIFPPGTEYIGSSIRPTSLSRTGANWSLVHIGIGNAIKIELELNITEYAPGNIVNRVMVCGMNAEACVSGAAYAALESAELPCCPMKVVIDKKAVLDASDPTLVHYAIEVKNNADSTVAATLTDTLPAGLTFLNASIEPGRREGQFLQWIVPDLRPGEVVIIEYLARATRDGSYVNTVHLDATAMDGTGYDTADASAQVEIRSSGVAPRTTRYGAWQPPDWNMTSPDGGITIELSPDEDLVE